MKWKPSDPTRWAHLNLEDPDPSGGMPKLARVPDVLAWALVLPGATDPVEGIVDGVRVELWALADVLPDRRVADVLFMLGRRLDAATQLLRWTDDRERLPMEEEFDEPPRSPPTEPDEDPDEDPEETREIPDGETAAKEPKEPNGEDECDE